MYLFSFSFFPFRQLNQQENASYLQLMSVHQWHKKFWAACSVLAQLQQQCVWWGITLLLFITICSFELLFWYKGALKLVRNQKETYKIFWAQKMWSCASLVDQMLKAAGNQIQKDQFEEVGFQYKSKWSRLLFHLS